MKRKEGSTNCSSEDDNFMTRTCGMWVDGEIQYHSPGNIIVFDDSKRHKAFNYSKTDRIVLIIDLLRPMHVALGTAEEVTHPNSTSCWTSLSRPV